MRPSDVDVELSESEALNASTSPLRETVSKPELKLIVSSPGGEVHPYDRKQHNQHNVPENPGIFEVRAAAPAAACAPLCCSLTTKRGSRL